MMRLHTLLVRGTAAAIGFTALMAMPAYANRAAADACAAALNADGQAIYNASVSQVASGGDIRTVVTDITKSLATNGQIDRGAARNNAEAAGGCLRQVKS